MICYNLTTKQKITDIKPSTQNKDIYLVIADYTDKQELEKKFDFYKYQEPEENLDQMIHFQIYETFDFVSLLYFNLSDRLFTHSLLNLYLGEQALVILTEDSQWMEAVLEKEIKACLDDVFVGREKINHLYYHVFHSIIHDMFLKLEAFEAFMLETEDSLLAGINKTEYPSLVKLKRTANEIKRNMRLLSYVSDEIVANDGGSLLESDLVLFKSINIRTKKIYEFAISLQETSIHLLTVYDSKISEQTNAFINKFTVITMFVTPLTLISSLYAMNFIGTPILSFESGIIIFLAATVLTAGFTTYLLRKNKWI